MSNNLIYLVSPYSHTSSAEMVKRFNAAVEATGHFMNGGQVVYSPIVHNHPIATAVGLPRGWDFWEKFDSVMLSKCDRLWVLMLPYWEQSNGIAAEIKIAQELGIPISYLEAKDYCPSYYNVKGDES